MKSQILNMRRRFFPPVAVGRGMQGLRLGLPMVERSRHANGGGFRIVKLKANGHELRTGTGGIGLATAVIMVLMVFHGGEFQWVRRPNSELWDLIDGLAWIG